MFQNYLAKSLKEFVKSCTMLLLVLLFVFMYYTILATILKIKIKNISQKWEGCVIFIFRAIFTL